MEGRKDEAREVPREPVKGGVRVLSDPTGARILVDGRIEDRTPAVIKGLASGKHRILFTYPGYEPTEKTVEVRRSEETLLWASLDPKPGTLTIGSSPAGGLILLDGKLKARTAWSGKIEAGSHTVVVNLEGHIPGRETVNMPPAGNVHVEILLLKGTTIAVGGRGEPIVREGDRHFEWRRASEHTGSDGAPMVLIPAGDFLLGSAESDRQADRNERPQRRILLDAFLIDVFEVPNAPYRRFLDWVEKNGHVGCPEGELEAKDHTPGPIGFHGEEWYGARQPVVEVDWWDAAAYCAWAGRRLPTEAEWEKAARGADGRLYPWGNAPPRAGTHGNFADLAYRHRNLGWTWIVPGDDGHPWPAPVGSFPRGASVYGVEDMSGNVAEWVADWYAGNYIEIAPEKNPGGPERGLYRILKGGAWQDTSWSLRSASRVRWLPGFRFISVGFRCAMDPPPSDDP